MVTAVPSRPAAVVTDLLHGGRWSSLQLGGREWLWQGTASGRDMVRDGDAFIDAGGLEECVPTVRGMPDHGSAWSRPWFRDGGWDAVDCDDFRLRRDLQCIGDEVVASYELSAVPGYRFVWAAHALLDLSVGARIVLPHGSRVRLYHEAAAHLAISWPGDQPYVLGAWPDLFGVPLDVLGPDDGTAIGATVLDRSSVDVIDQQHRLRLSVSVADDTPTSIALWRNLGGFPPTGPYRSIGVEPMLGSVFDLADAGSGDAAMVPESGTLRWSLRIRADRASS